MCSIRVRSFARLAEDSPDIHDGDRKPIQVRARTLVQPDYSRSGAPALWCSEGSHITLTLAGVSSDTISGEACRHFCSVQTEHESRFPHKRDVGCALEERDLAELATTGSELLTGQPRPMLELRQLLATPGQIVILRLSLVQLPPRSPGALPIPDLYPEWTREEHGVDRRIRGGIFGDHVHSEIGCPHDRPLRADVQRAS